MRILRLSNNIIDYARAVVHTTHDNKRYYNIKHSSKDKHAWVYRMQIDVNYLKPDNDTSEIILDKNNYAIYAVRDANKNIVKDIKNNVIYSVKKSTNASDDEYILFAESPFSNEYSHVAINKTKGDIELLVTVCGKRIMRFNNNKIKDIAPIFKIKGNACIEWKAVDKNGNIHYVEQIIVLPTKLPTRVTTKIRAESIK